MPFLDFFGGIVLVVFGIDPGYAIVGWGAINFQSNTYKTLGYGAIETVAGTDFNKRLEYIYDETYAILNRCRPDALAIEKLYFQTNQKTAINVAQARGVTLLAAQKLKIPIFEYTPLQVKTAVTGYGKAKKPQVTPDYSFCLLLYTVTDVLALSLRLTEHNTLPYNYYLEKLHSTCLPHVKGLRAPPCDVLA